MRWGWAIVALAVSGCHFRAAPPARPPITGGVQEGIASWYGPGFHGRRTASGEIYDQYDITAAHPSLPLGTRAVVTNLSNGRAVEVRINDRGPYYGGRVIDLSYGAARMIGLVGPGTGPVRIEVISPRPIQLAARETPVISAPPPRPVAQPPPPPPPPAARQPPPPEPPAARQPPPPEPPAARPPPPIVLEPPPRARFAVEIAAFSNPGMAEHLRGVLGRRFPEAHVSELDAGAGRYYRVRIGPYPYREVALGRAEAVNRMGYPAVIAEETDE
jgi:rare lipoprotein A